MARSVSTVNRRGDLLEAALVAFADRGYEGTSVAQLAEATELTKAAFVYHFSSKEDLLFELSAPLLDELDEIVARHETSPQAEEPIRAVLNDYLEALCRHRRVTEWIDGDKSILNHGYIGARIKANNRRAHRLLAGSRATTISRAQSSAILGMLWRPVRNGYLSAGPKARSAVLDLAVTAASSLSR